MKSILLTISSFLILGVTTQAQIFINTGNPNLDKYKDENPNSTMYGGAVAKDSTSTMKTPVVKAGSEGSSKKATNTKEKTKALKVVAGETEDTMRVITKAAIRAINPPATMSATSTMAMPGAAVASSPSDLPPNAEMGKCYARCLVPDKYEMKEEQVLVRAARTEIKRIAATYRKETEKVEIHPATTRYTEVPAVYETTYEDVLVTPASQRWERSSADPGCLSANPADCQVMCLKEVPAVYRKVMKKVVKTEATKKEYDVPAEYKTVTKQIVNTPARVDTINYPAQYRTVTNRVLVQKGGYSEWREILCASKINAGKILAIQTALYNAGYKPGALDNVMGAETKAALIKYQQDKGLPVGNLNIETMKSLGVEH